MQKSFHGPERPPYRVIRAGSPDIQFPVRVGFLITKDMIKD